MLFGTCSMLLSVVVVAFLGLPLSLGQISTVCFNDGDPGVGDCAQFIDEFCSSSSEILIAPDDSIHRCFNPPADSGIICDLTAWNNRPANNGNAINVSNCVNALITVVGVCDFGGSAAISNGNFEFTLDPNPGSCGSTSASTSI